MASQGRVGHFWLHERGRSHMLLGLLLASRLTHSFVSCSFSFFFSFFSRMTGNTGRINDQKDVRSQNETCILWTLPRISELQCLLQQWVYDLQVFGRSPSRICLMSKLCQCLCSSSLSAAHQRAVCTVCVYVRERLWSKTHSCGIGEELRNSHTSTIGEDKPLSGKCPT